MVDAFQPGEYTTDLTERIRLRHLRCFVTVAREQHVGRAAALLHLSQPAVTKTLNELDALAGARLLDRGRNGTRLTDAGQRFLRYAREVTTSLDAAAAALAGANAPTAAPLRIGALPTVASALVPEALVRLRPLHPGLDVHVRTDTNTALLSALASNAVDVVLGRMAEPDRMVGLSFELLYAEAAVFVVRRDHPLAGRPISPSEVLDHPLVVATPGTVPRHAAEAALERHGLHLAAGLIETLDLSVARGVLRRSDAVWITTERAPLDDLADGTLRRLDLPTEGTAEPVGMLRRSAENPSAAAEDFAALLREIVVGRAWQDFPHG